jgi:hypothetical protein
MAYPQPRLVQHSQGLVDSSTIPCLGCVTLCASMDLKNVDVNRNDIEVGTSIYMNMVDTIVMPRFRDCGLVSVAMTGLNTCTVQEILIE